MSVTPARGGREPSHGQDPADRSRADAIAEAEEFAPDAAVSPARILPGQPPDQFTDLLRDRRASGGVRVGPFLLYQAPVPDKQGARHHDPLYPKVPGQQPRQGGYHRPVSPVCFGQATWRRRTATSCRSTKISTFLETSLRARSASQPNNRTMSR